MILTLDIGNSQIFGGVFNGSELIFHFRKTTQSGVTSDELGIFLKAVLRENEIDSQLIKTISICSVVPKLNHSIRNACIKYFSLTPFFLKPGVKTGLKINYRSPVEVGADRIANAIAACQLFPARNLVIIDFGTANTFCVVDRNRTYLGGLILPGLRISMEALQSNTAKLMTVEIEKPEQLIGRSTMESIQAGLYYSAVSSIEGIVNRIKAEFKDSDPLITIGTGGMASLLKDEAVFDVFLPNLVLDGLRIAAEMNSAELESRMVS